MPIKHLVLSGGGVRGIATLGALNYLIEKNVLKMKYIRTITGSSIGGIISLLLNCKYTPNQIYEFMLSLDFKTMFDPNIKNLLTSLGFDTGILFVNKLKQFLMDQNIDPDITFIRLYNLTKQKLTITATSLNNKTTKYFNYISTPHFHVIDVVRASMGIPILFTTVKNGDEHLVDGGLLDNFPLHLFKGVPANSIIAIKFKNTKERLCKTNTTTPNINNIFDVIISSITCLVEEIEYLRSKSTGSLYNKSCIMIDTQDYHMLSVNITQDDKKKLYNIGKNAAQIYVNSTDYICNRISELPLNIQYKIWFFVHANYIKNVHIEIKQLFKAKNAA